MYFVWDVCVYNIIYYILLTDLTSATETPKHFGGLYRYILQYYLYLLLYRYSRRDVYFCIRYYNIDITLHQNFVIDTLYFMCPQITLFG